MLNLLIKNGLILDGCGNPGFFGTVAVEGDSIHILRGDASDLRTKRTIDATGKVVSPGFIDVHSHSALTILADPRHEPKVHQGVTTELIGIDGNSYAPFPSEKEFRRFLRYNSGLDGDPDVKVSWSSVSDYLAMYDKKVAVNIAYIVGNSPLRIGAVGWQKKQATKAQLQNMKALLREAMEDGAFGMSTGLDYPPGRFADTDELVALSGEVTRLGGFYHTHSRYWYGDRYLDPFKEAIEIGRRSGVPVHITHMFRRVTNPGGARPILGLVESARDEGLDVTFDCFPYAYGGTRIIIVFPEWAQNEGPEKLLDVLRSPDARERLRNEVKPRGLTWDEMWLTYFKRPKNKKYEGKSVSQVAEMRKQHPVDALCDLLVEEELRVSYFAAVIDPLTINDFVTHPLFMVGSDALLLGDFPPPMAYGCYPVILGEIVREEKKLSLPDAVRRMTSYPAQRLGLRDRGVLRDGMKADLVVFDPRTIKANAARSNTRQRSTGVEYVVINGQVVIDNGQHTGALPGRALKRGRVSARP
ncbi:MAG: D-aminoacylase [SAR202 cluster bacterium]|nr:D-aminoacylase [SAR202 cluster bacterium]